MKKETVEKNLNIIKSRKKGVKRTVYLDDSSSLIALKDCPICKNPSPMDMLGRFLCRKCVILFN